MSPAALEFIIDEWHGAPNSYRRHRSVVCMQVQVSYKRLQVSSRVDTSVLQVSYTLVVCIQVPTRGYRVCRADPGKGAVSMCNTAPVKWPPSAAGVHHIATLPFIRFAIARFHDDNTEFRPVTVTRQFSPTRQ